MHGPAKLCVQRAKAIAREKIFQDKRKTLHEIGAYTTLEILLNAFCGAALEQYGGHTPSFKNRRILDLLGRNAPDPQWPLYRAFLQVIDFIAGMTDSYATEMAREMTGRSEPPERKGSYRSGRQLLLEFLLQRLQGQPGLSPGACRHSPSPLRRQASSRASQASSRVRAPIIRAAPLMRWACSAEPGPVALAQEDGKALEVLTVAA